MSGEVSVTIVGSTTAPGELRFTPAGLAVCNFTLAVNPRRFDKQAGEWKEQAAQFYRCAIWREAAENAAEALAERGVRLIVMGTLNPREFTDKEGAKRLSLDVDVEEMGPSIRFATVAIKRTQRGAGGGGSYAGNGGGASNGSRASAPADDPWATAGAASTRGQEEPPF